MLHEEFNEVCENVYDNNYIETENLMLKFLLVMCNNEKLNA